jgi:Domain of unknown function (DUF4864)
MRWAGEGLVGAGLLALLLGCSSATGGAGQTSGPAVASKAPPTAAPLPSASAPAPAPGVPECPGDVVDGIDDTLTAQLAAFADGDFRSAFALASEGFRSSVDLKGFRAIIRDGYPEVASSTGHRILECRQPAASSASALVAVTGADGVTAQLGYRFVLEPGGWRVDGASTLATAAPQTA